MAWGRPFLLATAGALALVTVWHSADTRAQDQPAAKMVRPLPVFEVDPNWPKMPANFSAPFVSGVMVDPKGNAWLTTRAPKSPRPIPAMRRSAG